MSSLFSATMREVIRNPVRVLNKNGAVFDEAIPDPFVIRFKGIYYCYATGINGVLVLKSQNLSQFQYLGYALSDEQEWEYWAPCVVYSNGTFYMYYSSRDRQSDNPHDQRMKVAISKKPEGPFQFVKQISNSFCIDADVQIFESGKWGMFYATNDFHGNDQIRPGTTVAFDEMINPIEVAGNPIDLISASCDREIFARNRFGDGRDWHTIEAPCYLKNDDREFLMYSGNAYTSKDYFVGCAKREFGCKWSKLKTPIIQSDGYLFGTGHNSVVTGPNGLDCITIFHGMEATPQENSPDTRRICVARILPSENGLSVIGSLLHEFNRFSNSSLSDFSEYSSGNTNDQWQMVHPEQISRSEDNSVTVSNHAAVISKKKFQDYHMEVFCKGNKNGGNFGIYISYINDDNFSIITVNPVTRNTKLTHVRNGEEHCKECFFGDIDFSHYQLFRVDKCGCSARVYLNSMPIGTIPVVFEESAVGVRSLSGAVTVSDFLVTEHLELTAENYFAIRDRAFGHTDEDAFTIENDRLVCSGTTFDLCSPFKVPYEMYLGLETGESSIDISHAACREPYARCAR